ncbi:MAG: putative DNA binding domain-containing protein [Bacteroides sp.]|nr:putative DNA binding domain-containing protein [Bacteroides sp.]
MPRRSQIERQAYSISALKLINTRQGFVELLDRILSNILTRNYYYDKIIKKSWRQTMSLPVNIDELINERVVESNRIEFKREWNPTPIIHSICAFANDIDNVGGGYIIIGIEEKDGMPVFPVSGIEENKVDSVLKELVGLCHCIEPLYNPIVEPVIFQNKHIIVIWVYGGSGRPYKASKDVFSQKSHKLYYIRKFSSTIVASSDEEKELFYVSSTIPFDDRPNLAADVDDLDLGLLRQHLKEINSSLYEQSVNMDTLEIAKNLQLVSGPPESLKPLNVGILMFSEHPEKYFRYSRIEVVDIPDPTGSNMTEKNFTGPIQRQLKDALLYIKNYAIKEAVIKTNDKAEAVRIFNYPYAAIEEILSNAVYHRSYQINEPITVRISPSSMEITSFPGFDRSITDKNIAEYQIRSRIYRNRRIGDFLKELKLIEGRNTGFPNAIKALETNGSDKLRFDMDENRNYLSVTIPIHSHFLPKSKKSDKELGYRQSITDVLEKNPLTKSELAKAMGYRSISARLSSAVDEMVDEKILVRVIVGKSIKFGVADK